MYEVLREIYVHAAEEERVSRPGPQREVAILACWSKGLTTMMAFPLTCFSGNAAKSMRPLVLFSSTTTQLDSTTKARSMSRMSKWIWKRMEIGRTARAMSSQRSEHDHEYFRVRRWRIPSVQSKSRVSRWRRTPARPSSSKTWTSAYNARA